MATVEALSEPAAVTWSMARVAALLSPYFDKDTPQGVREIEAEDWAEALAKYPSWAIERACRWWKSADNPNRRKRPLEGDIEDRIRYEMRNVRGAKAWAKRGVSGMDAVEAEPPVDAKTAREILQRAGFAPRRFGEALE